MRMQYASDRISTSLRPQPWQAQIRLSAWVTASIATPGHLRIVKRFQVAPVLAQQSPRELDLTRRSYENVIDSASWAVFQEGYTLPWGADGDHLKSPECVEEALSIGCTMITADLSDHVRTRYANDPLSVVRKGYETLEQGYRQRLESEYLNSTLHLDTADEIALYYEEVMRNALVYGGAIEHAARMFETGKKPGDLSISRSRLTKPMLPPRLGPIFSWQGSCCTLTCPSRHWLHDS